MKNLELSLSILSLFETSKQERATFCQQVIDSVESGNVNPLTVHLQMKCTEEIIKSITGDDRFKSSLLDEAKKYDKQEFHNAKIEIRESGVKYSFEDCGDLEWKRLKQEADAATEALKNRENFLKTIPPEGVNILVDGGELIHISRPIKTSTTTLFTTLK